MNVDLLKYPITTSRLRVHVAEGLKFEKHNNQCFVTGSIEQVANFANELQKDLKEIVPQEELMRRQLGKRHITHVKPDIVVCGSARQEVKTLLENILTCRTKVVKSRGGFQIDKKFQLMPFCMMIKKYYTAINLFMQEVTVFVKDIQLPYIKVSFQSKCNTPLMEMLQFMKPKYRDNELYIHKDLGDLPLEHVHTLRESVLNEIHPRLLIFVRDTHMFMESVTGVSTRLEQILADVRQMPVKEPKPKPVEEDEDYSNVLGDFSEHIDSKASDQCNVVVQIPKDYAEYGTQVRQDIQVETAAIEYILHFYKDDLHLLAAFYHVLLDDSKAYDGCLTILPLKNTRKEELDMVIQQIRDYVQNVSQMLKVKIIETSSVQEKFSEYYWHIYDLALELKVRITKDKTKLHLLGHQDNVAALETEVNNILELEKSTQKGLKYDARPELVFDQGPQESDSAESDVDKSLYSPVWYLHNKSGVSVITSVVDVTTLQVDAIVNASSSGLFHCGGTYKYTVLVFVIARGSLT